MTNAYKICIALSLLALNSSAQNALNIPPALTGTTFNLDVQAGSQNLYPGNSTPTFGINGAWMAPTIIVNKGDSITLNVINNLPVRTTMHWHGLHVSPQNDGGPHQSINPNTTWSPSFKVRNNASTFWYHPHGAGQTDPQVSKGLAGLFIVRDPAEAALNIPRNYGADDVPLIVQSKAFDELKQIAIATNMDTAIFVNGTRNAYFDAPAQVVRLRLLNASSLRSYNFGLSNGQSFYQIGTDGGLLDTPVTLTRLIVSPGERAEILVDFSGMTGNTVFLKSFASELPDGIFGAAVLGSGADTVHEYEENFLNGADFDILRLNIVAATATPVTSIPVSLVPMTPFDPALATVNRTIVLDTIRLLPAEAPNRAEGPFGLNDMTFDMEVVNEIVYLNTTEIWTLKNNTLVAHPFHIHDIQFNVIEEGGVSIPAGERGWKDVVLVMPNDSVKFLTRFETFADPHVPYMYHCHLLHHEDDGMMGTFVVLDTTITGVEEIHQADSKVLVFPNPAGDNIHISVPELKKGSAATVTITDLLGRKVYETQIKEQNASLPVQRLGNGMYLVTVANHELFSAHKISIRKQ
jgi:blue copper oxidase